MLRGLDQVSEDRLFAQRLARFQPMQAVHENEPLAIASDHDWSFLPDLQYALGDFLHSLWFERRPKSYRYIDLSERKFLTPHHVAVPLSGQPPH
jgi:hypothetical protein